MEEVKSVCDEKFEAWIKKFFREPPKYLELEVLRCAWHAAWEEAREEFW